MNIFFLNGNIAVFRQWQRTWYNNLSGYILFFIICLILVINSGCAEKSPGLTNQADTTPPLVTCSVAEGSTISASKQIIFSFSESMNKATLVLSGIMAGESDGGVWSSRVNPDDTLTVSAQNLWSGGNQRTLILDAQDLGGNPLAEFSTFYIVDATLPSANVMIANGSSIQPTQQIVIVFSKTMNTPTFVASGTLLENVSTGSGYIISWSQTTAADDTLTLAPVTLWFENSAATQNLVMDVQDSTGYPVSTISLNFTVDGTAPSLVFNPVSGALLNGGSVITLNFSETIDTSTFVLSGMGIGAVSAWATTVYVNDTVLISPPAGGWPGGSNTLNITAADLAGNVRSFSSNYTVDINIATGIIIPASGSVIAKTRSIVITFSKSMETASLSLSGTMAAFSNGGGWSMSTLSNDTLTITPLAPGWNGGTAETLNVNVSDLAGNIYTANLTFNVDAVGPTAIISHPAGPLYAFIGNIEITISEPVEPATLVIGGTLASGASYAFSGGNTLLSFSQPVTGWPLENQTLTVTVSDIYGNSSGLLSWSYGVLNTVIYVDGTSGSDANTGTKLSPKQNPQAAIDFASGFAGVNEVHVAAGTYGDYLFGGSYNPPVILKDGIKVYGGYNATTWTQNTVANPTILTTAYTGNSNPYIRGTVVAGSGISSATVISGFYIKTAPNGYFSASVLVDGGAGPASQPQITGNYIGFNVINSDSYYGIYVTGNAYPSINNNTISGGAGAVRTGIYISGLSGGLYYGCFPSISNNTITNSPSMVYFFTWGIQIFNAGATINKNYIDAGLASNDSTGVSISEPRDIVNLENNVIIGGNSFNTTGVEISGTLSIDQSVSLTHNTLYTGTASSSGVGISYNKSSAATSLILFLRNNIIYGTTGSNMATCFTEASNGTSIPFEVKNNDFFCTYKYMSWTGTNFTLYTLASQTETYLAGKGVNVSGTLEVNPVFNNMTTGDLHLGASSPCTVTQSTAYLPATIDMDGITRTAPQSMGAYEWDGGCL